MSQSEIAAGDCGVVDGSVAAAADVATLADRTLTPEKRFSRLCENTPYFRIERELSRIAVNVRSLRTLLHWREDLGLRLDEADRRVSHAIRALEGFSTAYMRLKTGERHKAFVAELKRVRRVLVGGDGGCEQDGEDGNMTLAGLYTAVRDRLSRIRTEPPVDEALLTSVDDGLRSISALHMTLKSVLVAELPHVAEHVAAGTLLDNCAWAHLMCIIKASREEDKPRIISEAMAALVADMDRTARQIAKVRARTTANGATESEEAAANRRSCALRASLRVMRTRLVALSSAFYKYRARHVSAIAEYTKSVAATMRHAAIDVDTAQSVNAFRHRHPIQRDMDDILGIDASLDAGRGANPHHGYSMAAIMRHFKDNYVERITNSGETSNA